MQKYIPYLLIITGIAWLVSLILMLILAFMGSLFFFFFLGTTWGSIYIYYKLCKLWK